MFNFFKSSKQAIEFSLANKILNEGKITKIQWDDTDESSYAYKIVLGNLEFVHFVSLIPARSIMSKEIKESMYVIEYNALIADEPLVYCNEDLQSFLNSEELESVIKALNHHVNQELDKKRSEIEEKRLVKKDMFLQKYNL